MRNSLAVVLAAVCLLGVALPRTTHALGFRVTWPGNDDDVDFWPEIHEDAWNSPLSSLHSDQLDSWPKLYTSMIDNDPFFGRPALRQEADGRGCRRRLNADSGTQTADESNIGRYSQDAPKSCQKCGGSRANVRQGDQDIRQKNANTAKCGDDKPWKSHDKTNDMLEKETRRALAIEKLRNEQRMLKEQETKHLEELEALKGKRRELREAMMQHRREEQLESGILRKVKQEEEERLRREEVARMRREEEDRLRREEIAKQRRDEEERQRRKEIDRMRREEHERLRQEEVARMRQEEVARMRREYEEGLKREEIARQINEDNEQLRRDEVLHMEREEAGHQKQRQTRDHMRRGEERREEWARQERLHRQEEREATRRENERDRQLQWQQLYDEWESKTNSGTKLGNDFHQNKRQSELFILDIPKDYAPDELKIKTVGHNLKIKGKQFCNCEDGCAYREFERSLNLPKNVPTNNLSATLDSHGRLRINGYRLNCDASPSDVTVSVRGLGIPSSSGRTMCQGRKSGLNINTSRKIRNKPRAFQYDEVTGTYDPLEDDGVTVEEE